ncbi:MAG: ATP synthase F1 subunit epsilon [Actinomycetota bacterium]|nr:ATP synthase F1 subunit epsilon [Actinomycetota bacterium]
MSFRVELVSAEEDLFTGDADFLKAKTVEGEIGILTDHAPLLAQLAPGQVKVKTSDGERTFEITGGFMTVKDNKVIILAE